MKIHIKDNHHYQIDTEDLLRIEGYVKTLSPNADPNKWQLTYNTTDNKRLYYVSKTIGGRKGKKWKLHRLIMHLRGIDIKRKEIDHINGDGLDNRFDNLRVSTSSQNKINRGARKDNRLGMKGVELLPSGRYASYIFVDGKKMHIGVYDTPEEAGLAYNRKAIELWGEYTWTNKVARPKK
jgi:hypothetical protein